jgi:hypothetical protein
MSEPRIFRTANSIVGPLAGAVNARNVDPAGGLLLELTL